MVIDYISDLHEDYQELILNKENIKNFLKNLAPRGEILLIAGDISEDNDRLVLFLSLLLNAYNYRKIFFVLGNHELYGLKYSSYKDKIKELKNMLKEHSNIILLDGDIVEYSGIKIGGCMMWYDGSYSKYFEEEIDLNELWNDFMPDASRIANLDYYKDPFFEENKKINKIYQNVDILITHISPLCHPSFVIEQFRNDPASSFFSFNGEKYIKNTSAKHWIFGHIHSPLELNFKNISFHCNPYGYRRGAKRVVMQQIII